MAAKKRFYSNHLERFVTIPAAGSGYDANEEGSAPDEYNPRFLFQGTASDLLVAMARGDFNPVAYANAELANRGLDDNGEWIGHAEAKKAADARNAKLTY